MNAGAPVRKHAPPLLPHDFSFFIACAIGWSSTPMAPRIPNCPLNGFEEKLVLPLVEEDHMHLFCASLLLLPLSFVPKFFQLQANQ